MVVTNPSGSPNNALRLAWERLRLLLCAPSENGVKGENEMYLNTVTLTGFLGGNAESRTTKSKANFVTFSLATKNSWKDRETGEWNSRTEWHRAVVFGRLATSSSSSTSRNESEYCCGRKLNTIQVIC
jgi:hypothetical protein